MLDVDMSGVVPSGYTAISSKYIWAGANYGGVKIEELGITSFRLYSATGTALTFNLGVQLTCVPSERVTVCESVVLS